MKLISLALAVGRPAALLAPAPDLTVALLRRANLQER